MIKKTPLTFIIGFAVISGMVYWAEYSLIFKEQLARKDDVIGTLKEQLHAGQNPKSTTTQLENRSATSSGDSSPANVGEENTFVYGDPTTAKKTGKDHKK